MHLTGDWGGWARGGDGARDGIVGAMVHRLLPSGYFSKTLAGLMADQRVLSELISSTLARANGSKPVRPDDTQKIFRRAFALAEPPNAYRILLQLRAMSEDCYFENPEAACALHAWEDACTWPELLWREAHTAAIFWGEIAKLPEPELCALSTPTLGSATAQLGQLPLLQEKLQLALEAECTAWDAPRRFNGAMGYDKAVRELVDQVVTRMRIEQNLIPSCASLFRSPTECSSTAPWALSFRF